VRRAAGPHSDCAQIKNIGDKETKCLTPAKLAAFYKAVGGNYDCKSTHLHIYVSVSSANNSSSPTALFVDLPNPQISFIYQSIGRAPSTTSPSCTPRQASASQPPSPPPRSPASPTPRSRNGTTHAPRNCARTALRMRNYGRGLRRVVVRMRDTRTHTHTPTSRRRTPTPHPRREIGFGIPTTSTRSPSRSDARKPPAASRGLDPERRRPAAQALVRKTTKTRAGDAEACRRTTTARRQTCRRRDARRAIPRIAPEMD
jgi:hypothetical protein